MTRNTISNDVTIAGGGGTLLANRYRIVRQLGQGGMGSVWLAEDTQLDGKPFAIKMLPSILVSNKRAYRQLKDEALVAMKLTHPNIVTLRAFEENNGNPFLVMDYVEGQTLDDYLAEKGKLSEGEVIRLLKPVAVALDYAHGEGVVHRDVKPANVMVRKDGHPFILDFGIAREIQETMTRVTGKLSSGTLLYMSPEQLNGDAPKPAQDVYSFAAMVYECLKGEPPFSRGNIEFQIMNKEPEPLVGRDGDIAPLAAAVMAGLAKKPEERPVTCLGVLEGNVSRRAAEARRAAEIRRAAARRAVASALSPRAAKASSEACADGPRKRNANGLVTPLLCLLAAMAVLCGAFWYRSARQQEAERKRAVAARQADAARRQAEEEQERKLAEEAARRKAQLERLAREEAEAKRKAREAAAARLAKEREIGRQAKEAAERRLLEEMTERERQKGILENIKAEVGKATKHCEDARKAAVDAGAEEFAKNELSDADRQFEEIKSRTVSTEKEKDDILLDMSAVMRAYNRARDAAAENARPRIYLTASLDGVEKEARITEGVVDSGLSLSTPINIDIVDMPLGSIGTLAVEYSEDGIAYESRVEYTVKNGRQDVEAKLKPKYTLPANIRHCRHCGLPLAGHSRNINTCPKCGRSLFH